MATLQADAARRKKREAILEKLGRISTADEWQKVDNQKLAKLRGILSVLQEENQSTQLLKRERDEKEADSTLQETRRSVSQRLAVCKSKEVLFLRKQAELKKHVMDNERAIRDLEATIEKSERKVREEQAECKRLDLEIQQLTEEQNEQELARKIDQQKIQQISKYKRFLEEVVQCGEEDFEGDIEVLINRYATLEAGQEELQKSDQELQVRLDRAREECLKLQTKLQNEHLMISSKLHECQVDLDRHLAEAQELEGRLNRALEEKELKDAQLGVVQMAVEQLFSRAVTSCRLAPRKKAMLDATDVKFGPVRGDKADIKLEEMFNQVSERVEDLQDMARAAQEQLNLATKTHTMQVAETENWSDKFTFKLARGPNPFNGSGDQSISASPSPSFVAAGASFAGSAGAP